MSDRPLVPRSTVENLLTGDPGRTWIGNYGWRANQDGSGFDVVIRDPQRGLLRITQNDRGEFRLWDGQTRGGRRFDASDILTSIRESIMADTINNPQARMRFETLYRQHGIDLQTGYRARPMSDAGSHGQPDPETHRPEPSPGRYASLGPRPAVHDQEPQRTADVDWRARALTPTV